MTLMQGGHPAGQEPARRLFFAIWPDEAAQARLAAAVREFVPPGAGRPQRPDQWHVTLEFLGEVPESRLPVVLDAGAAASGGARACELALDQLEYWKRPQVLCLVAGSIPEALAALVQSLRSELQLRGFTPETRPFRAHVTLARKLRQAPPLGGVERVRWPVRRFSLVQSVTEPSGSRYLELAAWPAGA